MYKYKVYKNELITPTVRLLTLACEESSKPLLYEPGQYAAISLHDRLRPTTTRCFSITSSPTQREILQFGIRVGGIYTRALARLKEGDLVTVRGPFGRFVLAPHSNTDTVLLAGGIGISPFMSMLRYANDLNLKNKIHLVYSCRSQNDIAFYKELTKLAESNPNLKITYIITKGSLDNPHGANVISGRLDKPNIEKLELNPNNQTYMICGPKGYIKSVKTLLRDKGVPENRILSEAFSQGSGMQTEKLARWPNNTYALAGLSLLLSGIFVIATDINKTLPTLSAGDIPSAQPAGNNITADGDLNTKINSLRPQVDTDLSPKNTVKYITNNKDTVTQSTTKTPVATQPPAPRTVTPTPPPKTVTPTSPPKTKTS